MDKKTIVRNIGAPLFEDVSFQSPNIIVDIDDILTFVNRAKMLGATSIKFTGSTEYDNCYVLEEITLQPVTIDLETDLEFQERLKREKAERDRVEDAEKRQLEKLLQKYGK